VSPYTIRSADGVRQVAPAHGRRFVAVETDAGVPAVVDRTSGEIVAYASALRALELAQFLNALAPTPTQVAVLLGDGDGRRLLRRIDLQHAAICSRCGSPMRAGSPAMWHRTTRLVRHLRACPKPRVTRTRRKRAA
jgi:hypothetical protein